MVINVEEKEGKGWSSGLGDRGSGPAMTSKDKTDSQL